MSIWVNIRVHAYVSVGVRRYACIHMHVCCPDGREVSSGEMVGVKHLGGSKPRSGQLQWPMFKVNGGLRWLFISRLLHPCWTPSANRHRPSSSSLSLFLYPSTGTYLKNTCPLGSILCLCACRHIHMLTHRR